MFKAVIKKKWWELHAMKGWALFLLPLFVSLHSLLNNFREPPMAGISLGVLPIVVLMMGFIGIFSALAAFGDDFKNQANLFLDYLPLKRSTLWLANYSTGLCWLCLGAICLLWLDWLLFPFCLDVSPDGDGAIHHEIVRELTYLFPGRFEATVSWASFLFWMYSAAMFPVAFMDRKDATTPNQLGAFLILASLAGLPLAVIVSLCVLCIVPSGLELAPVLVTSGLLFSAGSFVLFAWLPKHLSREKRGWIGAGLFLAITGALVGHLYVKHLAWRVLDVTLPLRVEQLYWPNLLGSPNLIVADISSYRSGVHCVAIDVEKAAYVDLGRGLSYIDMPDNRSGLLYFWHSSVPIRTTVFGGHSGDCFMSMGPEGTRRHSFVPSGDQPRTYDARWLPDKQILVYSDRVQSPQQSFLCVADSSGKLLRRFEMGVSGAFLVSVSGQALALMQTENSANTDRSGKPASDGHLYLLIDLESGAVHKFKIPYDPVFFSKDLRRVICRRLEIRNEWRYTSYVRVELPTMGEKPILSESECPVENVISPVNPFSGFTFVPDDRDPCKYSHSPHPIPFLKPNDAFDAALWLKRRVDGDRFHYSIVHLDLNTGQKQVVVEESEMPSISVTSGEEENGKPILQKFTSDEKAFTYSIGPRWHLCDIQSRKSTLLGDMSLGMEPALQERLAVSRDRFYVKASPSGRQILSSIKTSIKSHDNPNVSIPFAAINVFQNGKPIRLYTGQDFIHEPFWLNEQRIIFQQWNAVYLLDASGGPPRQVFPPMGQ